MVDYYYYLLIININFHILPLGGAGDQKFELIPVLLLLEGIYMNLARNSFQSLDRIPKDPRAKKQLLVVSSVAIDHY